MKTQSLCAHFSIGFGIIHDTKGVWQQEKNIVYNFTNQTNSLTHYELFNSEDIVNHALLRRCHYKLNNVLMRFS